MEIEKELGRITGGYQQACVLFTANKLKIFDEIGTAPATEQQVAQALKLSANGVKRLLDVLTAMDIVTKNDGGYQLTEEWAPYLTSDGEHCVQQWIRLSSDLMPPWMELPRFIQTGNNVMSIMEMLGSEPENMRTFIDAMHNKGGVADISAQRRAT